MDTQLTSGTTTIADASGPAVTTEPTNQGQGSAAPEGQSQDSSDSTAGGSQGTAEDGQSQSGQRRGWSKVDEIRDLRQWRREAKQREAAIQNELLSTRQQMEELRRSLQQPPGKNNARTPADFWQDPLAAQERLFEERLGGMEERLLERMYQTREMEAQQYQVAREQESAVEFIRSQPNYAQEDDEDLIDIIESIPAQTRQSLSPQWVAEYAWMKLMQEKGVGNRSVAKARASTVIGQPPGVGLSGKMWNKSEFDAAVDALERQGAKADQKLLDELMNAAKEGRVRN